MKVVIKMYKVWNEDKSEWMHVDNEWMKGVNLRDNVEEINCYHSGERLEVVYKNGHIIYYDKVRGSWGLPLKF